MPVLLYGFGSLMQHLNNLDTEEGTGQRNDREDKPTNLEMKRNDREDKPTNLEMK